MSETPTVADEVVTKAIVRYLDLPFGAGTAAMITLDNGFDHTKPNSFGPGGLKSIDEALDEVSARTDLAAVCLTGKPFIFAVGADLTAVPQATDRSQALQLGKEGHRVFNRFSEL
ncbi:MAG: 3-hydroxyacyl-CoA dehydrogenase, partial [Candidatus Nanopelagicales bacterium]